MVTLQCHERNTLRAQRCRVPAQGIVTRMGGDARHWRRGSGPEHLCEDSPEGCVAFDGERRARGTRARPEHCEGRAHTHLLTLSMRHARASGNRSPSPRLAPRRARGDRRAYPPGCHRRWAPYGRGCPPKAGCPLFSWGCAAPFRKVGTRCDDCRRWAGVGGHVPSIG
jgi:hypothetical protein